MIKDEGYMEEGSPPVYRFYNPDTDRIYYEYNGKEAPETVRKQVQKVEAKEQEDFRSMKEGSRFLTGIYYGFLIGKMGRLVFKTNSVPQKGKKWDKGQECGNNTNKTGKYTILEELGTQLKDAGKSDLDLRPEIIRSTRVLNAAEACIVMELMMRYLDILRFNGLRWFYRPVYAKILGHLGAASPIETKPALKPVPETKPVPPPVQKKPVKSALDLGDENVEAPVSTRLSLNKLKQFTKQQLQTIRMDQLPKDFTTGNMLKLIQNAPDTVVEEKEGEEGVGEELLHEEEENDGGPPPLEPITKPNPMEDLD
jgi:hypothetical protein